MGGASATYGGQERFWGGETEGKRPLRRPGCILEDNIKKDLQELVWRDMDWIIWFKIGTSGRHL
jgi:hypothetical protein